MMPGNRQLAIHQGRGSGGGRLIARISAAGTPFTVGSRAGATPKDSRKAFLQIVPSPWGNASASGSYRVGDATGPYAGENDLLTKCSSPAAAWKKLTTTPAIRSITPRLGAPGRRCFTANNACAANLALVVAGRLVCFRSRGFILHRIFALPANGLRNCAASRSQLTGPKC